MSEDKANSMDENASNDTSSSKLAELFDKESKKNLKKIVCVRCDSLILQAMSCEYYENNHVSIDVPSMRQKKDLITNNQIESDAIKHFWLVNDMFTFENAGFTNTVDNKKYLICADCEIGPIGLQNMDKPNEFLVCIDRVKHE